MVKSADKLTITSTMKYELTKLPYAYDALEPHIDKETMEIHHTKHHQAYTNNMNAVLDKYPDIADRPLEELLRELDALTMEPADKKAFQNNAGGYINHNLFWEVMGPEKKVDEKLKKEIVETFGSVDAMKKEFSEAAIKRFGSGWAWLCRDTLGTLSICSTKNQNTTYKHGHTPLFGIDVWEHAYYLKYQNKRAEYIENWWHVLRLLEH
jgi:superoxide dismutase, Fe-Mn family